MIGLEFERPLTRAVGYLAWVFFLAAIGVMAYATNCMGPLRKSPGAETQCAEGHDQGSPPVDFDQTGLSPEIWVAEHDLATHHLEELKEGEPFILITFCVPGHAHLNYSASNTDVFDAIQKLMYALKLEKEGE